MNDSGKGVGLRGGKFKYKTEGSHEIFNLDSVRWTEDVSVSGRADWDYNFSGAVTADLKIVGPQNSKGSLKVYWRSRVAGARAEIAGTIGSKKVAASMYAP